MAATFVAAQLAYSPLLQDWNHQVVDSLYAARIAQLRMRLTDAGDAPLVISLGSSRIDQGVIGAALEARVERRIGRPVVAFNFACSGCGPVMQLVLLSRLLHDGIRPALVLVEVFPALLADGNEGPIEGRWLRSEQLSTEEHARIVSLGIRDDAATPIWMRRFVPTVAYRTLLVRRLGVSWLAQTTNMPSAIDVVDNAWGELPRDWSERVSDAQRQANTERRRLEFPWLSTVTLGPLASSALRELLEVCRSSRVKTALVVMPEGSAFRGWYAPPGLRGIMHFVHRLGDEYGVQVVDASDWMDDRSFRDSEHLLPAAARSFSERLGTEIDPLVE